jgi:hypothetical protein
MTVIQVSERELNRLKVVVDLADGRISADAAAALMGVGRRQVFRLPGVRGLWSDRGDLQAARPAEQSQARR